MDELKQFIKESVESVVQYIVPVEFQTVRESINESIERAVSGFESRVSEAETSLEKEKENVNIPKTIDDLQQKKAETINNIKKALIHHNNYEQCGL